MHKLSGKVAVVTGGATGIGRAISLAFAEEGADVVIVSNVLEPAEKVVAEISAMGRKSEVSLIDVTDAEKLSALAADLEARYSGVDILVTCAGIMGARTDIINTKIEDWLKTIDVNLNAAFYSIKAFLPAMIERDKGRVITLSSASGKLPAALNADYAASKHGVIGLTKALALELGLLGKNGITANALCPGPIDTPMMDEIVDHAIVGRNGDPDSFKNRYVATNIQRRLLSPGEVADMALYLASDNARGVTGQAMNICGGKVLF